MNKIYRTARYNKKSVTNGVWIFVECKPEQATFFQYINQGEIIMTLSSQGPIKGLGTYYKPVIVSMIENLSSGDERLCMSELEHGYNESYGIRSSSCTCTDCKKILVFSHQLSKNDLDLIVVGAIKHNDKCLVEIDKGYVNLNPHAIITPALGKVIVHLIESERGWGSKVDDVVYVDTMRDAKEYVDEFNSHNTEEKTPDWYMRAEIAGTIQP